MQVSQMTMYHSDDQIVRTWIAYESRCPHCGDINASYEDEFRVDEDTDAYFAVVECTCGCIYKVENTDA